MQFSTPYLNLIQKIDPVCNFIGNIPGTTKVSSPDSYVSDLCSNIHANHLFGKVLYEVPGLPNIYSCVDTLNDLKLQCIYHETTDQMFEFIQEKNQKRLLLRYNVFKQSPIPLEEEHPFTDYELSVLKLENVHTNQFDISVDFAGMSSDSSTNYLIHTDDNKKTEFCTYSDGKLVKIFQNSPLSLKPENEPHYYDLTQTPIGIPKNRSFYPQIRECSNSTPVSPSKPIHFLPKNQSLPHDNALLNHRFTSNTALREIVFQQRVQIASLIETINSLNKQFEQSATAISKLEQQIKEQANENAKRKITRLSNEILTLKQSLETSGS